MSDNRGHDWLDDAAAERLLRSVHRDRADRIRPDGRAAALAGLLAAAAAPAPLDPEREEAAVAAFRAARDGDATSTGFTGGRLRAAGDWSPGTGTGRTSRGGRGRAVRHPGRLRAATLIATAALAGAGVAAAGVLPALLGRGVPDPSPLRPRDGVTAASDSASPSPRPTAPSASSGSGPGSGPGDVAGGGHGTVLPGRTAGAPSSTRAQDHASLCRVYAAAGRHHKGVDEQVYKQLREAAGGGEGKVRRYCAGLLGVNNGSGGDPGKSGHSENAGKAAKSEDSARGENPGKGGGSANSGNPGKGGKAGEGDASGDEDPQDDQDSRKKASLGHRRPAGPGPQATAGE
ncbi:hypothetical protein PV703_20820 [Streptomyces sp. ME01-24h]|nr:hypothetical protein [Streptomyces sp. ME01-24h]